VGHPVETAVASDNLHNKPIGCGASGAYVPGPHEEEEAPDSSGGTSIASHSEQISSVITV